MVNTELLRQYIEQHGDDKDLAQQLLNAIEAGEFINKSDTRDLLQINRTQPLHIRFKQSLFEDDYIEPGMEGHLVDVKIYYENDNAVHYTLYFDMSLFMESNKRFLKEVYFPNKHTRQLPYKKELYTAVEAGDYTSKLTIHFGDFCAWSEEQHREVIAEYLEIVE